jgi:hypothetical protein
MTRLNSERCDAPASESAAHTGPPARRLSGRSSRYSAAQRYITRRHSPTPRSPGRGRACSTIWVSWSPGSGRARLERSRTHHSVNDRGCGITVDAEPRISARMDTDSLDRHARNRSSRGMLMLRSTEPDSACPNVHHRTVFAPWAAGVDVKHPLRIAALDASIGRIVRLQGSRWGGPKSAPQPPFK